MKSIYNIMFAGAIAICSVIACQVEDIPSDESTEEKVTFTFYAEGAENETKTIRQDDGAVWWDANENIKIFCNGISGKFTSDNKEPSATATFSGSFEAPVTLKDITEKGIMALYPYQEDAIYEDGTLTFSLPSEQVATKGTFGRDLFPCIASSTDTNLSFYNVCSGIKFSVVNDDIKSVTFKTSEEEPIAGLIEVDYFWNDLPSVKVKEGVSEVTVYAPDNGYFEPGEFYYITILPPPAPTYYFWDGFTMIYNKDRVSDSITINEPAPLPRSKFGVIEGKDAGLLFVDYEKSIEFADPVMKEMCVNAFDTNKDGELSFAEARSVTDLSKMTLTKKTFKSFDELQYFVSLKSIPYNYFEGCTLMKSITLPQNIVSIYYEAFMGCSSLTSIVLPEGMTSIGYDCFSGCSSLANIVLPESVTSIGSGCFEDCSSLTTIVLPMGVTSIGGFFFSGCSSLTGIVLPDGVTSLGDRCFYNCSSLTSIVLPEGVTNIGSGCFMNCSSLTSINIPEGVTKIGDRCFSGCSSLTSSISIPEGVLSIGDYTFCDCSSLTSINIHEGVTSIGENCFSRCSSLTSIVLPKGVTSIGDHSFYKCSSLSSINIPEGVISIGDYAFYECTNLTNVVIPENVISIGDWCFYGCLYLMNIYVKPIVPPALIMNWGDYYNFKSCSSELKMYVPYESFEAYITAEGWSEYADAIVGYDFENDKVVE